MERLSERRSGFFGSFIGELVRVSSDLFFGCIRSRFRGVWVTSRFRLVCTGLGWVAADWTTFPRSRLTIGRYGDRLYFFVEPWTWKVRTLRRGPFKVVEQSSEERLFFIQ